MNNQHPNSFKSQVIRLTEALSQRPLTTIEIREQLDICAPAAVIQAMRNLGLNIITTRIRVGIHPAIAQYTLLSSI